jgi:1,4-alpha-glucan branching enzyme
MYFPRLVFSTVGAVLATAVAADAQSVRPGWGATPYHDAAGTGVTFRVWAPNATNVTVPGQFNGWSTTASPLGKEGTNGVWSADLAGVMAGQEYKYFLNGSLWKRDPRGRKVVSSIDNSIVYDPGAFDWGGDGFSPPALEDLVIYELHIGSFYDPNPGDAQPGRFTDAINRLDYLKQLGVNAVEVLPVAEFPGLNSWGYNPADPFAVENAAYGGPDGFKAFVKACHARGLAVLLDVVHNHYGPSELDLWNFDGFTGGGSGGGIYFYQDAGICCTVYGPRPNYSRQPVRDYIQDNFKLWLDEYHVDGFRWDTPGLMLHATNGYVPEAAALIQQINTLISTGYPGKISIAEDEMGLGFNSTWDTTFPAVITGQLTPAADTNRDMNVIANAITNNTRFHVQAGLNRVVFLESHDVVGDLNNGVRLPTAIDGANPASYRARKLSTLGTTLAFTIPGVPMIFQGAEMLENLPFSDSRPVDWSKTNTFSGIVRLNRELIRLRRDLDGLTPGLKGGQCGILQLDQTNQLLAYRRWSDGAETQDAVVVANFANTTRTNYVLTFPRAGNWHVYFDSDSTVFGSDHGGVGQSLVTATGSPALGHLAIGPYSALIFSQMPGSGLSVSSTNGAVAVSWPAVYGGWVLEMCPTLTGDPALWAAIPAAVYLTNATGIVFLTNPASGSAYYRLRRP